MIDTSKHLWVVPIPESDIRGQGLFHATQDPERAEALAKEEGTVAIKLWLDGSMETWQHVTRFESVG